MKKLADYFNQGNGLKKVKKAPIPYYEAKSAIPSIWELLGWPDVGPNDPKWWGRIAPNTVGLDYIIAAIAKEVYTPIYNRLGMRFTITANNGGEVTSKMMQKAFELSVDQAAPTKDAAKAAVKKTETKTVKATAKKTTAKKSTKATAKKVANKAAK